jgi:hypothetical protein
MSRFDTTPTRDQIDHAAVLLVRFRSRIHRLAYIASMVCTGIDQVTHTPDRSSAQIVAELRAMTIAFTETRNQ